MISRIVVICFVCICCACSSDKHQVIELDRSKINGHWEVLSAKRNGRSTGTLKDAFFKFSNSDQLETNVLGESDMQSLTWRDSLLITEDSTYVYKINRLDQDSLDLSFTYMRYQFDLSLGRSTGESSEPSNLD